MNVYILCFVVYKELQVKQGLQSWKCLACSGARKTAIGNAFKSHLPAFIQSDFQVLHTMNIQGLGVLLKDTWSQTIDSSVHGQLSYDLSYGLINICIL